MKGPIIVAVSGGFDPLHIGHVRMFEEARKLGDELVVILNNDHWLRKKKGRAFMPEHERKEIIEALRCVDRVVLTSHGPDPEDMSVCAELRALKPNIFANGGDRKHDNIPEVVVCQEIGCNMVFHIGGGKVQSSSWLLDAHAKSFMQKYNKLVRDKIPEVIQQKGGALVSHIADEKEYWEKLKEKLLEEFAEFAQDESAEEIADMLEVIDAFIEYKGFNKTDVMRVKEKKANERGRFKDRIILDEA